MRTDEKPDFKTEPDPIEVPPPSSHVCEVRDRESWGNYITRDRLWRPVGTLWRCPTCWTWWVSRKWASESIHWRRVRPLTPAWFRCRKAAKEMR